MGEVWIPEAEDLTPVGSHNAMSGIGGPRATLHCTVSYPGSFDAMHRVLTSKTSEPHLLYDPKTDRLGQYFPLDRAARALARGTLAYSHNRVGSVNIQIEVCEMPRDWTAGPDWNPGPKFRAMMRAIRSHGIADEFIFRPANTAADRANVVRPNNLLTSTAGGGKWWGHCHYGQGETHWDPGPLNLTKFFGAASVAAPATPPEEVMPTPQEIAAAVWAYKVPRPDNTPVSAGDQLGGANINAYRANKTLTALAAREPVDPAAVATALAPLLVAALPATSAPVSTDELEAALRKVLGSVDGVSA